MRDPGNEVGECKNRVKPIRLSTWIKYASQDWLLHKCSTNNLRGATLGMSPMWEINSATLGPRQLHYIPIKCLSPCFLFDEKELLNHIRGESFDFDQHTRGNYLNYSVKSPAKMVRSLRIVPRKIISFQGSAIAFRSTTVLLKNCAP